MRKLALGLLLFWGVSSVCFAGLFDDAGTQQKLSQLQQQVQALDGRLSRVESKGLVSLLNETEGLKLAVRQLRGQLEVLSHELNVTEQRQKDLYADLDSRLRRLESNGSSATAAAPVATTPAAPAVAPSSSATVAPTAAVVTAPMSAAEQEAYAAAFNQFKIGNYQGAIVGFQHFIQTYPKSRNAASAQYWIGNSYFNLRAFKKAIASQRYLIAAYPASPKASDAMLNMASSYQGMGNIAVARKTLSQLIAKYPISHAAELAKQRLDRLK